MNRYLTTYKQNGIVDLYLSMVRMTGSDDDDCHASRSASNLSADPPKHDQDTEAEAR